MTIASTLRNDIPLWPARVRTSAGSPNHRRPSGRRMAHPVRSHPHPPWQVRCMVGKVLSSEGSPAVMNGQRLSVACLERSKGCVDAVAVAGTHYFHPVRSVAPRYACPLSPRPERFTQQDLVFRHRWRDARCVRDRVARFEGGDDAPMRQQWNAFVLSSSVMLTYLGAVAVPR